MPTFKEVGFPLNGTTTMMLFGPARMPPQLVARLHAAVQPMFAKAAIREKLSQQALAISPMTPQEMTEALRSERKTMGEMVKASGYVAQAPD